MSSHVQGLLSGFFLGVYVSGAAFCFFHPVELMKQILSRSEGKWERRIDRFMCAILWFILIVVGPIEKFLNTLLQFHDYVRQFRYKNPA